MNAVTSWIMSILALGFLTVLVDLLLANTKLHKMIQTVFATVTILVIIMPLPGLIKSGINPGGNNIFNSKIELDTEYLEYINRTKITALEKGVTSALVGDGIKNVSVKITAAFEGEISITNVMLNLKNLVIEKDYVHINKYEYVKEKVSGYLKISKELIYWYE